MLDYYKDSEDHQVSKKSVFLHRKSLLAENGAKMRHFLHRKAWWQAVRCQIECFSAPEVALDGVWCQNWHIPAPKPPATQNRSWRSDFGVLKNKKTSFSAGFLCGRRVTTKEYQTRVQTFPIFPKGFQVLT